MTQPVIRRLQPGDLEAVAEMFNRLSPLSRVRRFFSPTDSGPRWELKYLAGVATNPSHGDLVRVAEADGRIVGLARYVPAAQPANPADPVNPNDANRADPDHAHHADLAIVVEDDWQRHGLGRRLMAHLARAAAQDGITAFDVTILGDNYAALGLVRQMSTHRPKLKLSAGVFEGSVPLVA